MSKELREAIRAELLALDEFSESEAPTAREVLERLLAQATVEIFERGDRARLLAEAVARSQQASLAASATGGGAASAHLTPDFISGAAQAKGLGALWSFKGKATTADRIMQRAGLNSAKPSDLFKIKAKDKGKPEPEAQHAAYGALGTTQQRAGLYSMACAAVPSLTPA